MVALAPAILSTASLDMEEAMVNNKSTVLPRAMASLNMAAVILPSKATEAMEEGRSLVMVADTVEAIVNNLPKNPAA